MSTETQETLSLTDDDNDDDSDDEQRVQDMSGTLSKWTNYLHGWQDRYIVLKEGNLSYYKCETETAFGCRGAVCLHRAIITPHEFDDCRFDVSVNDCLWYLRAESGAERQTWMTALELHRQDSGYASETSLKREGSVLSLTSATSLSTASTSSFKRGRGLREKLNEMETFRDILCRQVDTLQSYFDACCTAVAHRSIHDLDTGDIEDVDDFKFEKEPQTFVTEDLSEREKDIINTLQSHGAHAIDFKGEAFTFKATTAGILATLSYCIELMSQREDAWKRRLEKEVEKRRRVEERNRELMKHRPKPLVIGGPDFEEGPHSMLNEEEFYDAVESTLEKLERDEELRELEKENRKAQQKPRTSLDPRHPLYGEIEKVVENHIRHCNMSAATFSEDWQLITEDGDMKVFKMEKEEDGLVVDPLMAVHTIKGITGHEMCHYFWDPSVRMEWEATLDSSQVVEWLSKDVMVTYQLSKRVWPSTQRESCFWSSIQHFPASTDEGPDYWIAVNYSTEHCKVKPTSKLVRMKFNVALICQTLVTPPESGQPITREHLTCRIQYSANINPGGWAPATAVRAISKRELPKFIKTFSKYVHEKTKDLPIMF